MLEAPQLKIGMSMHCIFLFILLRAALPGVLALPGEDEGGRAPLSYLRHPGASRLARDIDKCRAEGDCDDRVHNLTSVAVRVANDLSFLLLHDELHSLLDGAAQGLPQESRLRAKIEHIMSSLAFSQGRIEEAKSLWKNYNDSDLAMSRSRSAQDIIFGSEPVGLARISQYGSLLYNRLQKVMSSVLIRDDLDLAPFIQNSSTDRASNATIGNGKEAEETLLSLLLAEAYGGIRIGPKFNEYTLSGLTVKSLDASLHFRLGIGLSKLGLYDVAMKHISTAATPWETPLYRLRSQLTFPSIHSTLGSLAKAVDTFEFQAEAVLLHKSPKALLMSAVCNSLDDAALALQALPLLHLAGYTAPREAQRMGHSPVGLQRLLGEVYTTMCPSSQLVQLSPTESDQPPTSPRSAAGNNRRKHKVRLGVVSGSFDGIAGRLIVGMFDGLDPLIKSEIHLIAMCFPTPRDRTTDRVNAVFDQHVNLSPSNKTQAIERILASRPDFILFSDAGLDSRVFALAHERLSRHQGALWGWGGSLGIPSLDYYITPEELWLHSKCRGLDSDDLIHFPQELYSEQVILLEGLPPLPAVVSNSTKTVKRLQTRDGRRLRTPLIIEDWNILESRYLMPSINDTHVYLFPGPVRYLHPEFDAAIAVILRTDPKAVVIVATAGVGRDRLPAIHSASRYDLMHPAMPSAAVAKVKARLLMSVGDSPISRVRFLPPLEESLFIALRSACVAMLDPFPVGMHIAVLEALNDGVPVVSAPVLQECTNSHTYSISRAMGLGPARREDWPETAEDYGVFAIRLQHEESLRNSFRPMAEAAVEASHKRNRFTGKLVDFVKSLVL